MKKTGFSSKRNRTFVKKDMDNNISFAEKLLPKLKPLYKRLIADVSHINGEKHTFAVQWGKHFPINPNDGILFVGRATNHWKSTEENIDVLFGDIHMGSTIFNCDDQMIWVEHHANPQVDYNTNKSAFWRVIRAVAKHYFPEDELNYIAWSNVLKIQMESGKNPSGRIFDSQIETCKEIFKTELDVLSPRFIVMFTGGYGEREMLSFLNGGEMPTAVESVNWGNYAIDVYTIEDMFFFCTEHPQGKDEASHINCLIDLIDKYK